MISTFYHLDVSEIIADATTITSYENIGQCVAACARRHTYVHTDGEKLMWLFWKSWECANMLGKPKDNSVMSLRGLYFKIAYGFLN